MNNPIQRGPEMQELKRQIAFPSAPKNETNERTSISTRDPDTLLTMIVLLLCLPRACGPGACSCLVTETRQNDRDLFVTNVDRSNNAVLTSRHAIA